MVASTLSHTTADTALVVEALREALQDSGLTQAGLARALETSASRLSTYLSGSTSPSAAFFVRARRLARGLQVAGQLKRTTPLNTALATRAALAEGEDVWALKMVLRGRDDLRTMLVEQSAGADAWECDPGGLGEPAWDALFAAVVAHEFESAGRDAPRWTQRGKGAQTWVFANPFLGANEVHRRTPGWLAERGVFLAGRDLLTA